MGVVWRGRHEEQGIPVAVKVLASRIAEDQSRLAAFRDEIHAIAGLDHPHIVTVLDAGTVDARAAAHSGKRLQEGNPYLVMELCTGGTLSDMQLDSWRALREVLLTLLDALAHAHARGVAHLDLKPGNVLLAGPDDLRPGLKLTDFGIAAALEETQESKVDTITGTLAYMAPEQIRAEWRNYGPWTDLYALGCLTWRISVGRVPFQQRNPVALMRAQIAQPPPRLVDVPFPVPPGFDRWVDRMLAKVTWDRFQCAADAAHALRALGDPVDGPIPIDEDTFSELPTVQVRGIDPSELGGTAQVPLTAKIPTDSVPAVPSAPRPETPAPDRPAIPEDWRRPGPEVRSYRLSGAGLGLYGVRAVPVIGRELERDQLWRTFRDVARTGRTHVVTLAGAAGTGKSLLGQWLIQRARELGAANTLRYRFEPGAPADEGLRLMLRRFFRVQRLSPADRLARVQEVLERFGAAPDLAGAVDALLDNHAALNRRTRYVAIRRVLEAVTSHRPLIVWFDDVQWGVDALRLADHLLAAQRAHASPILVVLGYRTEALADRPFESNRLRLLEGHRAVTRVELRPLSHTDHAALARNVLPLSPALAARVAERTAGNPQLLHEVIGDWVERGLLVLGPEGLELRGRIEFPASLDGVWRLRILRVLDGLPPAAQIQLERAAVLGRDIDDQEWQAVCDDPEGSHASRGQVYFRPRLAALRRELRHRLITARMAQPTDTGWSFAHAMARHTLERMAQEAGRWVEHHRACAALLAHRELRAGDHERLGRHLVEAREPIAAFDALMKGVDHRETTVGFQAALGLLAYAEDHLTGVLDPSDARWGTLWARRANLYASLEDPDSARRWAARAWAAAEEHGWPAPIRGAIAFELGKVALYERKAAEAEQWLAQAVTLADRRDVLLCGSAWYSRSVAARMAGQADAARRYGTRAATELARAGRRGSQDAWRMLGNLALFDGDLDRARGYLRHALAWAEGHGDLAAVADTCNVLAELDRRQGKLDPAEALLRRSIDLYGQAGAVDQAIYPVANLALVQLMRRDWAGARETGTALRAEVEWRNRDALAAAAHAILATSYAGTGAWEEVMHHLGRCARLIEGTDIVEADLAWCFERVAELARREHKVAAATHAAHLAAAQRARLA